MLSPLRSLCRSCTKQSHGIMGVLGGVQSLHSDSTKMSKFALADKYRGLEKNVWVEFIQLALEYKPLNLGQGFPDDLVPNSVLDSLAEVAQESVFLNQYTRGFGHPRLVNALSELYTKLLDRPSSLDPMKEVLVTDGAYEALFTAILGHVNPGDEVIIIEPFFDCYEPMVNLAGGTPVFISIKPSKTKAIIFNNPNNPLGKVFKYDEILDISKLCIDNDLLMISDEVYEHMVFDDNKMIRM